MRVPKRNALVLLIFAIYISACGLDGSAQKQQEKQDKSAEHQETQGRETDEWLEYEPTVVELKGRLSVETFFGPPNFGENPESDTKENSWILLLDNPINIRAKTETDAILGPSIKDVQRLQLVLPTPHKELIGKEVIVKGTLFHAHTGHHHTDVLIDVQSISLAR